MSWRRKWHHGLWATWCHRQGSGRFIGIAAHTAGIAAKLVAKIRGIGGDAWRIGPGRKRLELEEIRHGDGGRPTISLGVHERQLGLGERALGLEQTQKRDFPLAVELLRETHGLAGFGKDILLVPTHESLGSSVLS